MFLGGETRVWGWAGFFVWPKLSSIDSVFSGDPSGALGLGGWSAGAGKFSGWEVAAFVGGGGGNHWGGGAGSGADDA